MALRQSFAKKALNYDRKMRNAWEESPVPLFATVALGAGLFFGGGAAIDTYKPLDDTTKPGQEHAITQHEAALTELQSLKGDVEKFHGSSHFATQSLTQIIDLDNKAPSDENAIQDAEAKYKRLLNAFATSVHVDERLSEANASDLMQQFETTHGAMEDVTSFDTELDYNDLDESRHYVKTERSDLTGENERAEAINYNSNEDNHQFYESLGVAAGGAFLPYLLMMMISMGRGTLNRWEKNKPKPAKKSGFNH